MRNAIQEYLNYSDKEKHALWSHAIFVFDTNVYLNLYRYTDKTRKQLMNAFEELRSRLWMPSHVAHELMKNRIKVILETNSNYDKAHKEADGFLRACQTYLNIDDNDGDYLDLQNAIKGRIEALKKKNVAVVSPDSDSVLEQLLSLYAGKVGPAFSEEQIKQIEEEGKERFEKQIPPGYKDEAKGKDGFSNNRYGDYIVWKQILAYASAEKKDIIFVTNDQKEDWWYIVHGHTIGPRVELKKEFSSVTKQKFYMYSMSNFITTFESEKKGQIDSDTIEEINSLSNKKPYRLKIQPRKNYITLDRIEPNYRGAIEEDEELNTEALEAEIAFLQEINRERLHSLLAAKEKLTRKELSEEFESKMLNTLAKYNMDEERIKELKKELEKHNHRHAGFSF